jgi:hypothetical protein
MLSSHLHIRHADGLLEIFNLSFICYMSCPFNSHLFGYPNNAELPQISVNITYSLVLTGLFRLELGSQSAEQHQSCELYIEYRGSHFEQFL